MAVAGTVSGAGADLEVGPGVVIPAAELVWQFSRAGGPGGQHVNTSATRVQLSWGLLASGVLSGALKDRAVRRLGSRLADGVVTITVAEHRSQARNRDVARERLAATIAAAIAAPPPRRRATRPTKGSQDRRVTAKKHRGETKRLRSRPERE
jgi:ribosome-associated protein